MTAPKPEKIVLKYIPSLKGWYAGGGEETKLLRVPTDEYITRFNAGEFQDKEGSYYYTERTEGGLIVNERSNRSLDSTPEAPVPAGLYVLTHNNDHGTGIEAYEVSADEYMELSAHSGHIMADIDFFLSNGDKWKGIGLLHRRGILIYGPQGTGKTLLVEHLVEIYKEKTRTIFVPSHMTAGSLRAIKGALDDLPTVFVFEEICSCADSDRHVTQLLAFLDGEDSWDHSLVIATTNYPEKLPRNVVDRPGRFDRIYKMDTPEKETRRQYLAHMMPALPEAEIEDMASDTKGLSLAYLKELVVAMAIYGKTARETISEFRDRQRRVQKEFSNAKDLGFNAGHDDDDEEDAIPAAFTRGEED